MRIPEHFEIELAADKAGGVLQEVRPESLPVQLMQLGDIASLNLFVISCADGHQFRDITSHTFKCLDEAKRHYGLEAMCDDCFHWRTENGGPYVLSVPELQTGVLQRATTRRGKRVSILDSTLYWIEGAMSLKKTNVGLLEAHCVCGMTRELFTSLNQYEDMLASSKRILMTEFGLDTNHLLCWLQAHCSKGRKSHHLDFSVVADRIAA